MESSSYDQRRDRPRWRWSLVVRLVGAVTLLSSSGCDDDDETADAAEASLLASASEPAPAVGVVRPPAPEPVLGNPNPLDLPPVRLALGEKMQVFTFDPRMLAGATEGSTLIPYAATAAGVEGDNVLIKPRHGEPYTIHSAYVMPVPDRPRLGMHDPVVAEWAGVLRHAVVLSFHKQGVVVRFTDLGAGSPERRLSNARIIPQQPGLSAGNYAVWIHRDQASKKEERPGAPDPASTGQPDSIDQPDSMDEDVPLKEAPANDQDAKKSGPELRHVMLFSRFDKVGADGGPHWLALGYGGAAHVIPETALVAIPIEPKLREGDPVWAEWLGKLRRGSVAEVKGPGQLLIRYERAGRPVYLGWGQVTPPLDGVPPPSF